MTTRPNLCTIFPTDHLSPCIRPTDPLILCFSHPIFCASASSPARTQTHTQVEIETEPKLEPPTSPTFRTPRSSTHPTIQPSTQANPIQPKAQPIHFHYRPSQNENQVGQENVERTDIKPPSSQDPRDPRQNSRFVLDETVECVSIVPREGYRCRGGCG